MNSNVNNDIWVETNTLKMTQHHVNRKMLLQITGYSYDITEMRRPKHTKCWQEWKEHKLGF